MVLEKARRLARLESSLLSNCSFSLYLLVPFLNFIDLFLLFVGKVYGVDSDGWWHYFLNRLRMYKSKNKALTLTKQTCDKAKVEVDAKVETILKDKDDLEKLHNKVGAKMKTTKGTISYLQK